MQVPILSGIVTDGGPDFRGSFPTNMVPVPKSQGISAGYLRPSDGIEPLGVGPGVSRGGLNWQGTLYRVMGSRLVEVTETGTVVDIGEIPGTEPVSMAYSFDRLAVAGGEKLFLYDGTSLVEVTDVDLGVVDDIVFVDGYFMTTDGEFLVVTELTDPTSVNPFNYGSSEADPDPVLGLMRLRNEVYALNRYTIEAFDNVGGEGFPFRRIEGAQIQRGVIGTHAKTVFDEQIAFVGSGKGETISVFVGINGRSVNIGDRDIEDLLAEYDETTLSGITLSTKFERGHKFLYVHLPDKTLAYDKQASILMERPVWHICRSGIGENVRGWRARDIVRCYEQWCVADTETGAVGYFVSDTSEHWAEASEWRFSTPILFNEGQGATVHEVELVALTGSTAVGNDPTIFTQHSEDGQNWSEPRGVKAGTTGNRMKPLSWRRQGHMKRQRMQRFFGTSDAQISPARLDIRLEGHAF